MATRNAQRSISAMLRGNRGLWTVYDAPSFPVHLHCPYSLLRWASLWVFRISRSPSIINSYLMRPSIIRRIMEIEEGVIRHFVFTTKTTQPRPQVFSVNRSIIWQFCCTVDVKILQNLVNISLLWWIKCGILANQKREIVWNDDNNTYY